MSFLFSKRRDYFIVLDIGTESVKSLAVFLGKDKIINIIGAGIGYFKIGFSEDSNEFSEKSFKDAISDSLQSLFESINLSSADKKIKRTALGIKNWNTVLSFPSSMTDSTVESASVFRKNPKLTISLGEEKKIKEQAIEIAKKAIADNFSSKKGIFKKDIHWLNEDILKMKMDGYTASAFKGLKGVQAELIVFASFMPEEYFKRILRIIKKIRPKLTVVSISHICQGISKVFYKNTSGFYIDVGGEKTQIFGFKEGMPEIAVEINSGGHDFIEKISETFGIGKDMAADIIERYSNNSLSPEANSRIKSLFLLSGNNWYNKVIAGIKNNISGLIIPKSIYLFGGASSLPEIRDSFFSGAEAINDFSSLGSLSVLEITLKDFKNIKDFTGALDSSKWIAPLLLAETYGK